MAGAEKDKRGLAERSSETVRNGGLVVAVIGTVLWLARQQVGADIFVAGVVAAGAGEIGRRSAAASNKK